MRELNKLMQGQLRAFAASHKEQLEKAMAWDFRDKAADDDILTLGCFIPGGFGLERFPNQRIRKQRSNFCMVPRLS